MSIVNKIKNRLVKLRTKLKKETPAEKNAQGELLNSIKALSQNEIVGNSAWDRYRRKLRLYILGNDPRNFLRWDPIVGSMFHNADRHELDHLVHNNWGKWSQAIEETRVGNPPPYAHYKKSSGNLIHIAYSFSQLLDRHKIDLGKTNRIIEFGAGYGCMAKLIHDLGFRGVYTIFDTPEFLLLQKYYLTATKTSGIFDFIDQINKLRNPDPDILIATWSLSESPTKVRNEFLRKIGKPRYVLIAYQANFESTDNVQYFEEYQKDNPEYDWMTHEIDHLPKNYYLIGKKK